MNFLARTATLLAVALLGTAALAQAVSIQNPWTRATLESQRSASVYMTLTARDDSQLIEVESPVAALAFIEGLHSTKGLDLPAGRPVPLAPGGVHIVLQALTHGLQAESQIPLTLITRNRQGAVSRHHLLVPVVYNVPAGIGMETRIAKPPSGAPTTAPVRGTDLVQIRTTVLRQLGPTDANSEASVEPITQQGRFAMAGWRLRGRGGRMLLHKDTWGWYISATGGDGLTDSRTLQSLGLPPDQARKLQSAVRSAEAPLAANLLAQFSQGGDTLQIPPPAHPKPGTMVIE